jgi:hypothetical protein
VIFPSGRKSFWVLAIALCAAVYPPGAQGAEVVVRPLSGEDALTGELVSLSADTIRVKTAAGEQSLPVKEIQSLEFPAPAPAEKPSLWLELVDGSKLGAQSYLASEGRATVGLLGGTNVQVATRSIRHVRFREHAGELAEQWQAIVKGEPTSDLLVIRRKTTRAAEGGEEGAPATEIEALDELDGTVLEVTAGSVKFEFGGDQLDVKRERIDGIVYFHPVQRQLPAPICRVTDASRSLWTAKSIELEEGRLQFVTTAGVSASLPLDQVAQLDFSSGNVAFLGELEAESTLQDGSFQPRNMTATFKLLKSPRWIAGGSQRPFGGEGLNIGGKKFTRGMALSSRTRLSYRIPEGMTRFRALAGLDDAAGPAADLTLVILADNREVYRQSFAASGERQPVPIDLEVGSAGRWTIVVEDGSGLDIADQLDLAEARFTK